MSDNNAEDVDDTGSFGYGWVIQITINNNYGGQKVGNSKHTHVDAQGSTFGHAANLGNIESDISNSIQTIKSSGDNNIADAFEKLTKAIKEDKELKAEASQDVLETVDALLKEAAKPADQRTGGVVKSFLKSIPGVLSASAALMKIWEHVGPIIHAHFGI